MRFAYTDEQRLLTGALRDVLDRTCPPARVRGAWDDGTGHAPDVWAALADAGLFGLLLPESDGGLARDEVDLVALLTEVGRAGVPGPVLEHAAVAAPALAGSRWAPALAAGTLAATVALDGWERPEHPGPAHAGRGRPAPGRPARAVAHAGVADLVLTPAGVVDLTGVARRPAGGIDGGRLLAEPVEAPPPAPVVLDLAVARDRAALAGAAVLVGVADRLGELAGDHARQRHQFGQPIGSFQAVKHRLADALLAVDRARPAVERAGWSMATRDPDRSRDVSMAMALAAAAALGSAKAAVQVHGALGYTWECDVHLFAKKAWALAAAYGDARWHRRRVADAILGPTPPRAR